MDEGDEDGFRKDEACFGRIPEDFLLALNRDMSYSSHGRPGLTLWGTGGARRELLHVDDLADACIMLMSRYSSQPMTGT
jgi:GDP-L-fucose synthase